MNGRSVSWVDKEATHSFMSPKLIMCWGLPMHMAGKPINGRFAKGKPHETKEVALHVTLKCGTLEFVAISNYVKWMRCPHFGGHLL